MLLMIFEGSVNETASVCPHDRTEVGTEGLCDPPFSASFFPRYQYVGNRLSLLPVRRCERR